MREKMRAHLAGNIAIALISKLMKGGITDIEFITQYLVLRYAHEKPKLTRWSDNVPYSGRPAQNDIMEEQEAMALTRAYTTLRDELHHLALQELLGHVSEDCFTAERELVRASWQKWLVKNEVWHYRAQILNLSGDRNEVTLPEFERAGVMVVGDVMLDCYWYGPTSRISPEAPVPVVKVNTIEERPGGAANVAMNIASRC